MSFRDKLKALAQRVPATLEHLVTEEATKNALIMPFIAALGYDVFNPLEVVPEFTADIGTKKGEKVDYAVKKNDQIILLFEAKKAGESLSTNHAGQLFRYFSVTHARIAVLTNGVQYHFFSDLDEPNKMDSTPFLQIDLLNVKDNLVSQLERVTREAFDLEGMLSAASDLKYMNMIRRTFENQLEEPDEEFVKFFFARANPTGRFVQSVRDQFARLVKQTLQQVVSDRVSDRLRSALAHESGTEDPSSQPSKPDGVADDELADAADKDGIVTTEEELEGYRIVQAIVRKVLPAERIFFRDSKSYFSIIVDNNNRKPVCRLHFNRAKKYIGLFDATKTERRYSIEQLSDIYNFAEQLTDAAQRYLEADDSIQPPVSDLIVRLEAPADE